MPAGKDSVKTKVSPKSTKGEIWDAYNELIAEVDNEPVNSEVEKVSILPNTLKEMSGLKLELSQSLDKISNDLMSSLNDLSELKQDISHRKKEMIENFNAKRKALEDAINEVETSWEKTKKQRELELTEESRQKAEAKKREDEEYSYNLAIKRRDDRDEYNQIKLEKEKKLIEREKAIDVREQEIAEMEKQITEMPAEIEKIVADTAKNITTDLDSKHISTMRELNLTHENKLKLSDMEIANMDNTIKSQQSEILSLKQQLGDALKQLKEVAISVIESRKPSLAPIANDNTK